MLLHANKSRMSLLGYLSNSTPGVLICCTLHCQVVGRRAQAVFETLHIVQCALQHLLITLQGPPHAQQLPLQTNNSVVHLRSAMELGRRACKQWIFLAQMSRKAGQAEGTHCLAAAMLFTQGCKTALQGQLFLLQMCLLLCKVVCCGLNGIIMPAYESTS